MAFDPDAFLAQSANAQAPTQTPVENQQPQTNTQGFDPDAFLEQGKQAQFGSGEQQVKAGLEGLAQGVLGPIAPYIEKKTGIALGSDIRDRAEANPITHGIGEGAGLVGSALTGTGLGAVLEGAGKGAAALTTAESIAPSLAQKIGSSAVQQAAEMAVLQGSDESAKMILNDPNTSSESAIANIGLATALGGVSGAFITGAVNPLWKATVGDRLGNTLEGIVGHLNRSGPQLPEDLQQAANTLGVDVGAEIRGANVSEAGAKKFNYLKRSENSAVQNAEQNLHYNISQSVADSIGIPIEQLQNYDAAEAGREGLNKFYEEARAKHEPIIKEFNELTEPFQQAPAAAQHLANADDKISEMALREGWVGKDVPQNSIVEAALNRVPKIKTAEDLKQAITEIGNIASSDPQAYGRAGGEIKKILMDTMQNVLGDAIKIDKPDLFPRYQIARNGYAQIARLYDRVGSELGVGKFKGPETFLKTIEEKRSPEEFLRRLSPNGNAELLPFLKENFPGTAQYIAQNELKKMVSPAVRAAKGDQPINVKTLNNAIKAKMAGQQQFVSSILPKQLIDRAQAAETLSQAIPSIKDSGTPAGIINVIKSGAGSAMGMVAAIAGHNPITGAAIGHIGQMMGTSAPEAVNLAMLRMMGSDQPVKAEGFKAAVDFLHNSIKGQTLVAKAAGNVFQKGTQVLTASQMPSEADRDKLDKIVEKTNKSPDEMLKLTNGQTGHYLPAHQAALSQSSAQAVQYLASIKPQPYKSNPLDRPIEPSKQQMSRYNRALDIANQPTVILQHVKDGTLQVSDIQDMKAMYPALYTHMNQLINNHMINQHSEDEPIPYKTRMGISLFGQHPMDASMTPMGIQMAQPKPQAPPQQTEQPKGSAKKSQSSLSKVPSNYQTSTQQAESDRSSRK